MCEGDEREGRGGKLFKEGMRIEMVVERGCLGCSWAEGAGGRYGGVKGCIGVAWISQLPSQRILSCPSFAPMVSQGGETAAIHALRNGRSPLGSLFKGKANLPTMAAWCSLIPPPRLLGRGGLRGGPSG